MKQEFFYKLKDIYTKIDTVLKDKSRHCRFCMDCCLDISELHITPLEIDYINYFSCSDDVSISWKEYNKKTLCPYCDIEKRICRVYSLRPRFCRIFGHFVEKPEHLYSACVYLNNFEHYDIKSIDKIPFHKEFISLTGEYMNILPQYEKEAYINNLAYVPEVTIRSSIEEYLDSIKKNPYFAPLYYHLAKKYSCLNMKDEAIEALIKSISLDPTQFQSYYLLGLKFYETGCIDYGITSIKRALRAAPNHKKALYTLGLFSIEAGKFMEALEYFGKLKKLEPDMDEAYNIEKYINICLES
ncbi:MAG: YkgJ family cysteine cluster protein [Candidatus Eremiobacterota bacterium]